MIKLLLACVTLLPLLCSVGLQLVPCHVCQHVYCGSPVVFSSSPVVAHLPADSIALSSCQGMLVRQGQNCLESLTLHPTSAG